MQASSGSIRPLWQGSRQGEGRSSGVGGAAATFTRIAAGRGTSHTPARKFAKLAAAAKVWDAPAGATV